MGAKHQNRLLVVVSSNYTSALFAFSIARYPPESISDLTVVVVYPIDESFWLNSGESWEEAVVVAVKRNSLRSKNCLRQQQLDSDKISR